MHLVNVLLPYVCPSRQGEEEERLAGWKKIQVDIKNWERVCPTIEMGASLNVELERLNARLNAAGPSPSTAVNEIEARRLRQKEEVCPRFQDITNRLIMIESGRRDGFARQGGSTNANTGATAYTTTTTTAASSPTATITPPTPSTSSLVAASELREEALFLRDRVKMRGELTRDMLEYFDTRQKAVDANIRFLEEALVACKVSPIMPTLATVRGSYCIVLFCILYCFVYCTVLHCTVLHCTILYCTVLQHFSAETFVTDLAPQLDY